MCVTCVRCVMVCDAMSCSVVWCDATWCHVIWCYVMSCDVIWNNVMSCHVMSYHINSCDMLWRGVHVMCCNAMRCGVIAWCVMWCMMWCLMYAVWCVMWRAVPECVMDNVYAKSVKIECKNVQCLTYVSCAVHLLQQLKNAFHTAQRHNLHLFFRCNAMYAMQYYAVTQRQVSNQSCTCQPYKVMLQPAWWHGAILCRTIWCHTKACVKTWHEMLVWYQIL